MGQFENNYQIFEINYQQSYFLINRVQTNFQFQQLQNQQFLQMIVVKVKQLKITQNKQKRNLIRTPLLIFILYTCITYKNNRSQIHTQKQQKLNPQRDFLEIFIFPGSTQLKKRQNFEKLIIVVKQKGVMLQFKKNHLNYIESALQYSKKKIQKKKKKKKQKKIQKKKKKKKQKKIQKKKINEKQKKIKKKN
eukprot:TRINITY_DN28710_c0_g1_i5.p1 TRINITY_DN28710_c0_g1~~TRINITY_DN28710_c0_g1_i5.p1  ORF type:complete len:192 (-),score=6.70 TRINITY_DN28710_c0_g1_i5:37-612(-)